MACCLLTAKGNNQLKDKNILDVLGHPVLYYSGTAGIQSQKCTSHYVSSECEKILSVAEELGYKRIQRPNELSMPNSQHIDAILHALNVIGTAQGMPKILVVILGNNITISAQDIDACVNIMEEDMSISAVVPIYFDADHNPYRAKTINAKNRVVSFIKDMPSNLSTNRQDLPKSCFLAHNFWVLNVSQLLAEHNGEPPWSFMGNKVVPYEIEKSIDIHDSFDLEVAALWLKNHKTD